MKRILAIMTSIMITPVAFAHPGHSWDILPHPYHHYLTDSKFFFIVSVITIAVIAYYIINTRRK
jgi:hypothetical protein